jgi:hypothetical protein
MVIRKIETQRLSQNVGIESADCDIKGLKKGAGSCHLRNTIKINCFFCLPLFTIFFPEVI